MTDELSDDELKKHRDQVSLIVATLLLVGESGNLKMIDTVKAGELLGRIKPRETGLREQAFDVPVSALKKAGIALDFWERAADKGIIEKKMIDKKPHYVITKDFGINDIPSENDFMERLVYIASMNHEQALATAKKFDALTSKTKGRLH